MTASLFLDNLFAWSAQIAMLVAVGAVAAITLNTPRARLIFWQGILAIALLLPAAEPWRQPMATDTGWVAIEPSVAPVVLAHPPAFRWAWRREYLLLAIATGAALRFLWIGAGLLRLRRHRLDARMLTTPPVRFSNPRVRWFVSSTVGGPVTFGFLNPSILLPARVAELPDDLREAIAHHELAHVRRRDWLFVLAEEAIRSLLWFHPAIWFVLSRIQLAREQVVDAEVVGLTRDRERYLDALVAVAAQRLLPDVAPAPLFLKKRQLAVRVAAVLKENRMSKPRTFLSYTTVCSAALIAVRLAVWMFPMQAPAQTRTIEKGSLVADGPGVIVEPGAQVLHRSPVFYPSGVTTAGTVIVESTVNAKGEVTDARVVSGPEDLRNAALSSVLNWHFSPDAGLPPTVQSVVRFTAPPQTAQATTVTATAPAVYTGSTLRLISIIGLSDELAEKVRGNIPVHVGDAFGNDQLARVREAVKEIDQHLVTGIRRDSSGTTMTIMLAPEGMSRGVTGGIIGGIVGGIPGPRPEVIRDLAGVVTDGSQSDLTPAERLARLEQQLAHGIVTSGSAQAPTASFPPAADGTQRIRVGGNVQAYNLIKKVTPMYPPLAKQARIQGTVRFTALIGMDGSIFSLQLVEGHPLLVESAREAVAQWMYKPTLLSGNPAEVITQIDVNYTLTQ